MDNFKIFRIFLFFILLTGCLQANVSWAQSYETQSPLLSPAAKRIKRDFTTVIFSSLAGGILGLSTLSFYGQPQDHTVNITTGILLGFAGGLGYVIYARTEVNRKPLPSYQSIDSIDGALNLPKRPPSPTYIAYSWEF